MDNFKVHLKPYQLHIALAEDLADDKDCLILDVGCNEKGESVASLKHVTEKVNDYLFNIPELARTAEKLYIIGSWNLSLQNAGVTEVSEGDPYLQVSHKQTVEEQEWHEATENISNLISFMRELKELTWISGLPLLPCIWTKLPTLLTKLVLDLGQPIRLHQDGDIQHKSYITANEMKPLLQQTQLQELRLLRLYNSLQCIAWETVFRNKSKDEMKVLDLQMAVAPLVRSEHWREARDVVGLTVPVEDTKEKEYKGLEGKGVLHYSVGTGEYLDDFCMRKARIASGLDEAIPLPLWCLKLDGFVIDHLPFQHELSRIVLLTCGLNCVNAGMRVPKTSRTPHNKWSKAMNNVVTHCVVQWPRWIGVFDDQGEQQEASGSIVSQDAGLSTLLDRHAPKSPLPLTEEHLGMKAISDALINPNNNEYFGSSPIPRNLRASQEFISSVSNLSLRGSDVPTPTEESFPALDGLTMDDSIPATYSSIVSTNSSGSSGSPQSIDGESFETLSRSSINMASELATTQQDGISNNDSKSPKTNDIRHKVRRSLDWLSGSS